MKWSIINGFEMISIKTLSKNSQNKYSRAERLFCGKDTLMMVFFKRNVVKFKIYKLIMYEYGTNAIS